MQGWMLSYKNPDPERMFSRTYRNEATAYKDASEAIEELAKEELQNLAIQDNPEERQFETETLKTVIELIAKGEHKEAYVEWREYAGDMTPDEDVLIEDTEIVEE